MLVLIVGNSRLHWGYFRRGKLIKTWETSHLEKPITAQQLPTDLFPPEMTQSLLGKLPVYIASVVTSQTKLWDNYEDKTIITLDDIPLTNTYSTLGIDRALCAYGAGETYGYPVLVVDGGTALTYTALGRQRNFQGGAILSGLGLQLNALAKHTAALPQVSLPDSLPQLWANSTQSAIESGVIHTVTAGIYDYLTQWWRDFSDGVVVLTGGDAIRLQNYLKQKYPLLSGNIIVDQTLMFQGIAQLIL